MFYFGYICGHSTGQKQVIIAKNTGTFPKQKVADSGMGTDC